MEIAEGNAEQSIMGDGNHPGAGGNTDRAWRFEFRFGGSLI
jgi:hypothetical protein